MGKIVDLLRAGGTLVVVEFAWDRIDEATAEWALGRLPAATPSGKPSWLERCCRGWAREEGAGDRYHGDHSRTHFARFAKVYAAWKPYRTELVKQASETGLPIVRHTFIHYPKDPEVLALNYQYMVGPELMVTPVLDPGAYAIRVYIPAGRWVHLWTGERYGVPERGAYQTVSAPIGEPAVFYKEGPEEGTRFREELGRRGLL